LNIPSTESTVAARPSAASCERPRWPTTAVDEDVERFGRERAQCRDRETEDLTVVR
jgi:hypothetical protein